MSREILKAACAFLAGLLVTAVGAGYWFGRNVPTQDQMAEVIHELRSLREGLAEKDWLLEAHGITVEALRNAATHAHTENLPSDPGSTPSE